MRPDRTEPGENECDFPLVFSRRDVVAEQRVDPCLADLHDRVLSEKEVQETASVFVLVFLAGFAVNEEEK